MGRAGNLWAIVLAGGEGTRLSQISVDRSGRPVPKQFCSVNDSETLLSKALRRARSVAGVSRTMVVVAAEHRCWWSAELMDHPERNIVVQPCNRGTACGVMLPLTQVLMRDESATVVVLPSDHVVADEATLETAIRSASEHALREPGQLFVLGFEAQRPDTGLGWIAPAASEQAAIRSVARFVEKPHPDLAEDLVREGALWNSSIFAIGATELFALFQRTVPWMTRMFTYSLVDERGGSHSERVSRLYARLPSVDFSRAVLQEVGPQMRVVTVPPCGWNDVGTPEGVARCAIGAAAAPVRLTPAAPADLKAPLDLVDALRAFEAVGNAGRRSSSAEG